MAEPRLGGEGSRPRGAAGRVARRAAREVRDALRPFTIPNGITLLRLAAIPFFALAVVSSNHRWALAIFVLAGVSDAVDGLLARHLGMRSLLGAYLDPIADKALLVTAYVVLTWPNPGAVTIPLWLTVLALSRDLLIVLVALTLYLAADIRSFPPSVLGKITTFFHIVTVGMVLFANVSRHVPEPLLLVCFYAALGFTVLSGVDYIRRAASQVELLHAGEDGEAAEERPHSGTA